MKYYEDALIAALNNKKTRYFCLACFITADITLEDIKNITFGEMKYLKEIITLVENVEIKEVAI